MGFWVSPSTTRYLVLVCNSKVLVYRPTRATFNLHSVDVLYHFHIISWTWLVYIDYLVLLTSAIYSICLAHNRVSLSNHASIAPTVTLSFLSSYLSSLPSDFFDYVVGGGLLMLMVKKGPPFVKTIWIITHGCWNLNKSKCHTSVTTIMVVTWWQSWPMLYAGSYRCGYMVDY